MSEELTISQGSIHVSAVRATTETTLESVVEPNLKVTQSDNIEDEIAVNVKCLSIVCDSSDESFTDAVEKAIEEEIKPALVEIGNEKTTDLEAENIKPKKKKYFRKHSYRKKNKNRAGAKVVKLEEGGHIPNDDVMPISCAIEKENEQPKKIKPNNKCKPVADLHKQMSPLTKQQPQPLQFRKKGHFKNNKNEDANNTQHTQFHKGNRKRQYSQNTYPPLQQPQPQSQPQRRFSGPLKFPNRRLVNHYDSWGYFTPLEPPNNNYYGSNPFQRPKQRSEKKVIIKKEESAIEDQNQDNEVVIEV